MKRTITGDLLEWKNSSGRKPLLLEGVRQCGKTYILKEFGKQNYDDVAYFTFEKDPDLSEIFDRDLDTERTIDRLNLLHPKIAVTTSSKSGRSSVVAHVPLYAMWNLRSYVAARP